MSDDNQYMQLALSLAKTAAKLGEVPVGAIVVNSNGKIIGTGFNLKETKQQAYAHAEFLAISQAAQNISSWRLLDCTLYVTLEPCLMCAGLIYQSRIKRVVFGTHDPKGGGLGSLYQVHQDHRLNHSFQVEHGVCQEKAAKILKDFFAARRR